VNVFKKNKRVDDTEARKTSKIDLGLCVHDSARGGYGTHLSCGIIEIGLFFYPLS